VNLDRKRLGSEQIFDKKLGPSAARILEPDFADRIAAVRGRAEHGGDVAAAPGFLDPAGDQVGWLSCFFRLRRHRKEALGRQP
jgi:hypothetical protein